MWRTKTERRRTIKLYIFTLISWPPFGKLERFVWTKSLWVISVKLYDITLGMIWLSSANRHYYRVILFKISVSVVEMTLNKQPLDSKSRLAIDWFSFNIERNLLIQNIYYINLLPFDANCADSNSKEGTILLSFLPRRFYGNWKKWADDMKTREWFSKSQKGRTKWTNFGG